MILQVCPSDYPPFAEICASYEAALSLLDQPVRTIILQPPSGAPNPGFTYLNQQDLRSTRRLAALCREQMSATNEIRFAICHRYRAARVAAKLRLPRLVVAHEFGYFSRPQRRLAARFERGARYAGVSPAVAEELGGEACVLPNVLDLARFRERLLDRQQARQVLGLDNAANVIGWVGRLHHKKQPQLAQQALAQMDDRWTLALVGDGPLKPEPSERIRVCGFVDQARRYFRAFDVLLVTSKEIEAFGMTALEAMAAGVPVVCSRAPGPAYVLGAHGCYYDEAAPMAIAEALVRAGNMAPGDYRAATEVRVRAEFSVESLAEKLRPLIA